VRIVIAVAQRMFASALGALLGCSGHDVVGYATALDAVADINMREQADMCVVDADMPWESDVFSLAKALSPDTAFVVLADAAGSEGLTRALSVGVHGAVLKSDDSMAFRRVLTGARAQAARRQAGQVVLSPSVQAARRTIRGGSPHRETAGSLTPREREVLARLVRGESSSAMARSMGIRLSTTRTHVDSVLIKLGAHSRLEAVALAVREGIVDLADGAIGCDWAGRKP
jgi:two-component system nitrate/nitrite response regulator NarL